MEELIKEVYEHNFYPGKNRLYKLVKKEDEDITKAEIVAFLDKQLEYQLTKVQNLKGGSGHITALNVDELWQMDTFDLAKYSTNNDNYKYIFAVVDVFSRKAWVVPMKKQDKNKTTEALQEIISSNNNQPPRSVMGDNASVYNSDVFNELLDKYKISLNLNVLNDHRALGIIDNFAKRLKTAFTKYYIRFKTKEWITIMHLVVNNFNDSENMSLNHLTPNQARLPKNKMIIEQLNLTKEEDNKDESDLLLNDKVRIKLTGIFKKGTDPGWSDEFYTVEHINKNTITLSNGKKYKRENLLKIPNDTPETGRNIIHQNNLEEKARKVVKQNDLAPIIDHEKRSQRIRKENKDKDFFY